MRTMKLFGFSLCLLLTFACKKDVETTDCARLEGTWQAESWTEENVQLLGQGQLITSADLTFKELDGSAGDYELNLTFLIGGGEMIIGAYTVNTACSEVILTPKAGQPETYDFYFEGNLLILEGTGTQLNIEIELGK